MKGKIGIWFNMDVDIEMIQLQHLGLTFKVRIAVLYQLPQLEKYFIVQIFVHDSL